MPNQKLLEALSCFSDKNRKRFREFVRSTFYNNKHNRLKISQLLDYLLALKNNKYSAEEMKEVLSQKFFPEHVYQPKVKTQLILWLLICLAWHADLY